MMRKAMVMMAGSLLGMILSCILLPGTSAAAGCSEFPYPVPTQLQVSPGTDQVPPGAAVIVEVEVIRGEKPESNACGTAACGAPIGGLGLKITPAVDDRTPSEWIGYRLDAGTMNANFQYHQVDPEVPSQILAQDGWLYFGFSDPVDEDLDFTVTIQAVDQAGNVGPASAPVSVKAPEEGGCATTGYSISVFGVLGCLLAAEWYLRRRPTQVL